jgi:hypothetical protein
MAIINLVTPKVKAKHEDLFNKPASGLLKKGASLSTPLGVTKFINMRSLLLVTLFCAT